VDIYNSSNGKWATAHLSSSRWALACASVVSLGLAFFAGGINNGTNTNSDVVDIYNGVTNRWTTDRLSVARYHLSAASLVTGRKSSVVLFAGGFTDRDGTISIHCKIIVDERDNLHVFSVVVQSHTQFQDRPRMTPPVLWIFTTA
jgi:hypothetical protein